MEGVPEPGPTRVVIEEKRKPAIQSQKERRWQEVTNEFGRVTDRLGKELDVGVLETVVGLNVLGVNTVDSCEGHMDHGTGAPYIDVAARAAVDLQTRFFELVQNGAPLEEQNLLIKQIDSLNLPERAKVMELLKDFYRDRQVPYDRWLVILPRALCESRIESQAASLQEISSPDLKQQKLLEYQAEMKEFTSFLKDKYFSFTPSG